MNTPPLAAGIIYFAAINCTKASKAVGTTLPHFAGRLKPFLQRLRREAQQHWTTFCLSTTLSGFRLFQVKSAG